MDPNHHDREPTPVPTFKDEESGEALVGFTPEHEQVFALPKPKVEADELAVLGSTSMHPTRVARLQSPTDETPHPETSLNTGVSSKKLKKRRKQSQGNNQEHPQRQPQGNPNRILHQKSQGQYQRIKQEPFPVQGPEQTQGKKRKHQEYDDENEIENSGNVFQTVDDGRETVSGANLNNHLTITTKIILFSTDSVELFIGQSKVKYRVHKYLLALHSPFFRQQFADRLKYGHENKVVKLRDVSPISFRFFAAWLYTGNLMSPPSEFANLWSLGNSFGIPAFSNLAMEFCFAHANEHRASWPDMDSINHMYNLSPKGSALRKFAAHSVIFHKPFETHAEGSEEYKEWTKLVKEIPDLSFDISVASGKNWGGGTPWDDNHKAAYMVEEPDLADLWDGYILSQQSKADLENAAQTTCLRSRIEFEHLNRKK